MTEGNMPPPERPTPRRQEGEQEHLREDAGTTQGGLGPGVEPAEHLEEDAGQDQRERKGKDKSLVDRAREKMAGS